MAFDCYFHGYGVLLDVDGRCRSCVSEQRAAVGRFVEGRGPGCARCEFRGVLPEPGVVGWEASPCPVCGQEPATDRMGTP